MEESPIFLLVGNTAKALLQDQAHLKANHTRRKHFARLKKVAPYIMLKPQSLQNSLDGASCGPIHRVPFSSGRTSYTIPLDVHELDCMIKQIDVKHANVPRGRGTLPVTFHACSLCKEKTVPKASLGTFIKQMGAKFPDSTPVAGRSITQQIGPQCACVSFLCQDNPSHQAAFMAVKIPPASLDAPNDKELAELCDAFANVVSTESSCNTKK